MSDIFVEALNYFIVLGLNEMSFLPTSGGVNNVVHYVKQGNEITHVLRIYNNGNDDSKVIYEHAVLAQLNLNSYSFQLPRAVSILKSNEPFVKLQNGASASLFKLIPGSLPKLTNVREIGRASGELNRALSRIDLKRIPSKSPNPPYSELYKVHHAVSRELFYQKINSSEFDPWRSEANFVLNEIRDIEDRIAVYSTLPVQLIHGDLHYDNVLCVGDKVTGAAFHVFYF
jgi:Ser/Thr protein kinase RdoA (MazF antagonist)